MKIFLLLIFLICAYESQAQNAAIFNGDSVRILKDNLKLNLGQKIIGNHTGDPQAVAVDANAGSLILRTNGNAYIKQDSGSSINWDLFAMFDDIPADTDDLPEGAANFYYTQARFDTSLATKDTDDLTEGATSLYFTDGRAQTATISQVITNGVTTKSPSEDAIFDALAAKQNSAFTPTTPADWADPDPTNIQEALDDLAAVSSGGITGSLTSGRVPYATGASTLSDDLGMSYNAGTDTLTLGALLFSPSIETSAINTYSNADLDINPNGTGEIRLTDKTGQALLYIDTNEYIQTATTSSVIAASISDETGTPGSLVFSISPAFTGTPTVPTAAAGTNTTQAASAAFVNNAVNSSTYQWRAVSANGQICFGNAAFNRIEFEDEQEDTEGVYDPSTGTVTPSTGTVFCCFYAHVQAVNSSRSAGDTYILAIFLNGVEGPTIAKRELDAANASASSDTSGSTCRAVTPGVTYDINGRGPAALNCTGTGNDNGFSGFCVKDI
jgi:hypothetical protein